MRNTLKKGRGIFTKRPIQKGEIVLEYKGSLKCGKKEVEETEAKYEGTSEGCYLFLLYHKGKPYM